MSQAQPRYVAMRGGPEQEPRPLKWPKSQPEPSPPRPDGCLRPTLSGRDGAPTWLTSGTPRGKDAVL